MTKELHPRLSKEASDIVRFLQTVPLFQDLPEEYLNDLSAHCRIAYRKKGSIIYRKEDSSSYLYVIKSGCIMESVFYGNSEDIIVKIRSDRDYFGETGMLTGSTYPNTALALEDSTLIRLPRSIFMKIVQENTCVCMVIIHELIDRLICSAKNMVNIMYLDAPGRLASTIVNLTANSQQKNADIRVTQGALASSSGMARQTAAKILSDWRREGIISTERGRLRIHDFNRLLDIILESEIRD